MVPALLVTLREGIEAALIVAIVLAVLKRLGRKDMSRAAWLGVATSVGVSVLAGGALFALVGELEGRAEKVFEGVAMFTAVGVLTYMIFWMARQGRRIAGGLEEKTRHAVSIGSAAAVFLLTFVAVVREGLETALFLFSTVRSSEPLAALTGSVLGLAAAAVVGVALYRTGARLSLGSFFAVTSVLLLLVAAGLTAHGVHEFQEAGLLPVTVENVYDLSPVLPQDATAGALLRAVFGYADSPTLLEVLAYLGYLLPTTLAWFLVGRREAPSGRAAAAAA